MTAVPALPTRSRRAPAPARPAKGRRGVHVRIFDHEPDLLTGVDAEIAAVLRRRVTVQRRRLERGAWAPPAERAPGTLGLLVLDGVLVRRVRLADREWPELLGAGDMLRPWDAHDGAPAHTVGWAVLEDAQLAELGGDFAAVAARFPAIMDALLERSSRRAQASALHLAIVQSRRAEDRLLLLFEHLAARWGRMTPRGVAIPLRLAHSMLAQLTCLQRPTTSSALQRLTLAGRLWREPDGTWLLLAPAYPESPRVART